MSGRGGGAVRGGTGVWGRGAAGEWGWKGGGSSERDQGKCGQLLDVGSLIQSIGVYSRLDENGGDLRGLGDYCAHNKQPGGKAMKGHAMMLESTLKRCSMRSSSQGGTRNERGGITIQAQPQ